MSQHGELMIEGDEFNRDSMYFCGKCRCTHTWAFSACDGLRAAPVRKVRAPMDLEEIQQVLFRASVQLGRSGPTANWIHLVVREVEKHHGVQ